MALMIAARQYGDQRRRLAESIQNAFIRAFLLAELTVTTQGEALPPALDGLFSLGAPNCSVSGYFTPTAENKHVNPSC